MKALVQTSHPAHVHFFKHFIWEADNAGYDVKVIANKRKMVRELLDSYEIEHEVVAEPANFIVRSQLRFTLGTYRAAKEFDPDVLLSVGGTSIAHASKFVRGDSYIFYDTEHATIQNAITYPFADRIYTPDCYQGDIGRNQIRYPGYQELAYLHPNRFTPDPSIRELADLNEDERFIILRLVSWEAIHDLGDSGFVNVQDVVRALEDQGVRVLITSEAELPPELKEYRVRVPPHRIHDLMYYADLFIGESATMATESAVLGTPAIFVSSSRRGYTDELEERYGLVFNFSENDRQQRSLEKALSILDGYDPETWSSRRERMLNDKIDATEMMVREILETQRFRDRKSDTS